MKIVDLTQTIEESMPVFPGTEKPRMLKANTVEEHGFAELKLTMYTHTGTHLDVPAHMVQGGRSLTSFSAEDFVGRAVLVDITKLDKQEIAVEELMPYEALLKEADFLILNTGWSKFWGTPEYFVGFPALNEEAVDWLLRFKLKGIGIDAISIDAMETKDFAIHYKLFHRDMIVIENLTNLKEINKESFLFSCLPLKLKEADGSPIRAIALID